ncbi:hypothetical protein D9756_009384 [Leucocoprinus leucothites]|uniref:Protein kinase domain-containing protein n=1 Tax=Leucocoprinus leucothites TaxID=201217 RepID=A0A8H5CYA1_9AGAR|nr:hypothetical protein D9756_009384 [Leucoagaricus leucothites]
MSDYSDDDYGGYDDHDDGGGDFDDNEDLDYSDEENSLSLDGETGVMEYSPGPSSPMASTGELPDELEDPSDDEDRDDDDDDDDNNEDHDSEDSDESEEMHDGRTDSQQSSDSEGYGGGWGGGRGGGISFPTLVAGSSSQQKVELPSRTVDPLTTEVHDLIGNILTSSQGRKKLAHAKGRTAQTLLDILQKLLDNQDTPRVLRSKILKATLQLCGRSQKHPSCPTLPEIENRSDPMQSGSFGEVSRGNCKGHLVCLKVAKIYQDRDINYLIRSYAREALMWSQLEHSNVLPFYGIYRLKNDAFGRVCLVSPWMPNGNIVDYLRDHPEAPRILLTQSALAGLKYLHEENIVHSDIKGANILVKPNGFACLADFGLSTVIDESILQWTSTQTTGPTGTLRFEAPELVGDRSEDVSPSKPTFKSDVFSMASAMYQTDRRDPTEQAPSAELEQSELTDEIWHLMRRCWARSPEERPTIQEIVEELKNIPHNAVTKRRMTRRAQEIQANDAGRVVAPTSRNFRSIIRGQEESAFSTAEVKVLKSCVPKEDDTGGTSASLNQNQDIPQPAHN